MNCYEKIEKIGEKEFKLITGVTKEVFKKMTEEQRKKHAEEHARGGRAGLSVEIRLTLALEYWREYRTFRHMSVSHGIDKDVTNRAVILVEDALSESEEFKIKELKERFKPEENSEISVIIVDVEEQPIERPFENQEASYSGKKKRHTTKYQIVINGENTEILDVYNAVGTTHDFTMFKESLVGVRPEYIHSHDGQRVSGGERLLRFRPHSGQVIEKPSADR